MRKEDWPEILKIALDEAEAESFQWGVFDCFHWTAEIVKKLTGTELARKYCAEKGIDVTKRPYMSEKGMLRTLKGMGYDSFKDLISDIYGEPIPVRTAKRGDIILKKIEEAQIDALGICRGQDVMFKTRFENIFYPLVECDYAWSIN